MILVTGATGRIGNVLIRELLKTNQVVRALVRKSSDLTPLKGLKIELVYGDVTDLESLITATKDCEYVYHLAGEINISNKAAEHTYLTNIIGVQNIIEACKRNNVKRMLYTSSIHAFNVPEDSKEISETTPLCEITSSRGVYDRSKSKATCLALTAAKSELDIIIVCPTGVTGPFDFKPSFFGLGIIESVRSGLKFAVPGGYDYVDVRDVVDGILSAMKIGVRGELYLLGGEYLSNERFFNILKDLSGIKNKTIFLPIWIAKIYAWFANIFKKNSPITPYSISTLMSNSNVNHSKATRVLSFSPRPIEESIRDQYKWFVDNNML